MDEIVGEGIIHLVARGPSAPTDLTMHEAMDKNAPIARGDVADLPGDLPVGDRDGVMMVPAHPAKEIAQERLGMEGHQEVVSEEVRTGARIIRRYPCTKDDNRKKYADRRQEADR